MIVDDSTEPSNQQLLPAKVAGTIRVVQSATTKSYKKNHCAPVSSAWSLLHPPWLPSGPSQGHPGQLWLGEVPWSIIAIQCRYQNDNTSQKKQDTGVRKSQALELLEAPGPPARQSQKKPWLVMASFSCHKCRCPAIHA